MQIQEIFLAAIEIDDLQERTAYVAQACGKDRELHRKVNALLAAHEKSGEFLDIPALQQIADGQPEDRDSARNQKWQEEIDLSFLKPSSKPGSLGRLLHYEVLETVGRGGCGIVLKAFDEKLHRVVAIKTMTPELATTSPARKRFLREARATAAIRHENVVSIYAVEEKPFPFLVMEFIDGRTLQDKINETGPLDIQDVLAIGRQIARGLEAAHTQGLIHRDIKPANILLESGSGRPKITDFGLARSADDASLTQSGAISGTPLYMSPEQAQGQEVDHRSDLFSLGSVLYVMCSGRPPFRAATAVAVLKRVVEEQPRPIREIIPETPGWLVSVIAKLHAKKPQKRFSSAHEVVEALEHREAEAVAAGRTQRALPSKSTSHFINRLMSWFNGSNRRRWPIPLALVTTLLICLGVWNLIGAVKSSQTFQQPNLPDGRPPSADIARDVSEQTVTPPKPAGLPTAQFAPANDTGDPIVGTWTLQMGPWPYTAEFHANGTGEGRFHPDVLKAIKNKNNGSGPPETFPMTWEKIAATTYSVTMLGVTSRDFVLNGDRLTCPHWQHPGERLSKSPNVTAFPDPDRRAAEYVIQLGGSVRIDDEKREIKTVTDLPNGPIRLTECYLMNRPALDDAGMQIFQGTRNIKKFDITAPEVTDVGIRYLEENSQLELLGLTACQVTRDSLTHYNGRDVLWSVWLRDTNVTDDDLKVLSDCKNLIWLGLGSTQVTDAGLSAFHKNTKLYQIDLNSTAISNDGLLQLLPFKNIGDISLNKTEVDDRGLEHLKPLKHLRFLHLSDTKVTDAGLKFLAGHHGLEGVYLNHTAVTKQGVESLAKAIPKCQIYWNGKTFNSAPVVLQKDADRKAAEYVTSINGWVALKGTEKRFEKPDDLPIVPFEVIGCQLQHNAQTSDAGLANFEGTTHLEWIKLDGAHGITDEGLYYLRENRNLRLLALSFNETISGKGLANFRNCSKLKNIWLIGTKITDDDLEVFNETEELTLLGVPQTRTGDVGLTHFRKNKNLYQLELAGTRVTDQGLATIAEFTQLGSLNLDGTSVTDRGLESLSRLTTLIYLSLSHTKVTDIGLDHFRNNKNLYGLYLIGANITNNGLTVIGNFGNLHILNLEGTNINDQGLEHLKHLLRLEELNIKGTKATLAGIESLKQVLPKCKITWDGGAWKGGSAQHLDDADRRAAQYVFSHDGIIRIQGSGRDIRRSDPFPKSPFAISSVSLTGRKAVDDEQLSVFEGCTHIQALWLSQTSVSDRGLAYFQQCRGLKSLDISQTKVTGPGLAHFAECPNLERVSVWFTRIPLEDFLPLADKPFKHLNFGGNSAFSDEWLPHFTHLENLELLNLRYTNVSNEGLAPLQQYRKLKYLSLGNTKVTDAGLDNLRNCTELEDVLLTETNVTDAGVKLFANCKKLKNLELEKTNVTAACIEELKRSLPQCRILWDGGVIEPGKP